MVAILSEKPVEYESQNVLVVPDEASWDTIRRHARAGDIKLRLDNAMRLLEERHPAKLQGVLPRIYANSALEVDQVAGLITLFSKDVFARRDGVDLLGRTYEYFIGNFASSEGTRGGEFFTPSSIVLLLVEMLEPTSGKVYDAACGSGGMFVQSARFTQSGRALSFYGQERIETTWRLGRMNLILRDAMSANTAIAWTESTWNPLASYIVQRKRLVPTASCIPSAGTPIASGDANTISSAARGLTLLFNGC